MLYHCYLRRLLATWHVIFLALFLCLATLPTVCAASPLRTMLVCGGPNSDFYEILISLARELKVLGLTRHAPLSNAATTEDSEALWNWMSAHSEGKLLQFLADGFYTADWDSNKSDAVLNAIRNRIENKKDVDLILAFGTWAGLEMSKLKTSVPVIVCGATDPVHAGIVPSVSDSGKDNVVAVVEPGRFERQLELLHRIFGFRKLGITYTDTPSGRSCAALDQIEKACARHDVELVSCTGNFFLNLDNKQITDQMMACHKKLVDQHVDAVFISYNSLDIGLWPYVLEPLIQANIPVISQTGQREVQMGALAGVSSYSNKEGRFVARLIHSLLKGAMPRSLPQKLISPMQLAINLRTAARIGWNPSLDVLMMVDQFFE